MTGQQPSLSQTANVAHSHIMQPQPQPPRSTILHPPDGPPINIGDLESINASGRGSPVQTPLQAPLHPDLPQPHALTEAVLNGLNSANSAGTPPSGMPPTPPQTPPPTDDIPRPDSDLMNFDSFSGVHRPKLNEPTFPILVDYSPLLKPTANAQDGSSAVTRRVFGSHAYPAPMVVLNVGYFDTLSVVLDRAKSELMNQQLHENERETLVQRINHMQLSIVWYHGGYHGQSVLGDDETFRRGLILVGKRGWMDHLVLRVKGLDENPEGKNVQAEQEHHSNDNTEGNGNAKGAPAVLADRSSCFERWGSLHLEI